MLNKTINGWNVQETEDGISFEHTSKWKQVFPTRLPEMFKDYLIKGIFESNGVLIIPLVSNGNYRLLKIEAANGCQYVYTIDEVPAGAFRRILKAYCEPEETGTTRSSRIIES